MLYQREREADLLACNLAVTSIFERAVLLEEYPGSDQHDASQICMNICDIKRDSIAHTRNYVKLNDRVKGLCLNNIKIKCINVCFGKRY